MHNAATATDFADSRDDAAIRAAVNGAVPVKKIWEDPRSLPSGLAPVAAFDIGLLPTGLARWVGDISDRMQAPPEFVAVPAMIAAGSVIGRKVVVRPQANTDWYVVPNLWGCIVGRPGVMKSPAAQAALKPLQKLEAEARHIFDQDRLRYEAGEMERELRRDAAKAAMKKRLKDNPQADTSDLTCADEDAPTLRRYTVNDSSYQSLGELLIENTNGLLIYRDELLSLVKSLDREENCEAKGFYLTGWNGDEGYTFDRIVRGKNLFVPAVTISMMGSTQPGKLRDYLSSVIRGGAGDDGLIQRFGMMVWPDIAPAWTDVDREPDPVARAEAHRVFALLDGFTPDQVGAQVDPFDNRKPFLRFDTAGLGVFQEWRAAHEARIRSGELHPAVESHLAKYRKLIPALALIHHLASGQTGSVGELSVLSALAWGEFLETHAHRIYSAALDSGADGARELLRHIRKGELKDGFSARDVYRAGWSGLSDKERATDALDVLEDYGWIEPVDIPTSSRGGRPARTYLINPKGLER